MVSDKKILGWAIGVLGVAFIIDFMLSKKKEKLIASANGTEYKNATGGGSKSAPRSATSIKFGSSRDSMGCSGRGICSLGGAGSIPVMLQSVGQTLMLSFSFNDLTANQPLQHGLWSKSGGVYVFDTPYIAIAPVFLAAGVPTGSVINGGTYTVAGDVVRLQLPYQVNVMGARVNKQKAHNV